VSAVKPRRYQLFASCVPGLEDILEGEVQGLGWSRAKAEPGGVTLEGTWHDVWRLNLLSRCASRILLRVTSFRAQHLSELEARTGEADWSEIIAPGMRAKVEAVCRKSKIYHSGAAEERVARALQRLGAEPGEGGIKVFVRIENNNVQISTDTSGELLHKRGFKEDVVKAPLRESLAASFLRFCEYDGTGPLFDPFCGSGTIPMEGAELALGLAPGRGRPFGFERFTSFDAEVYSGVRNRAIQKAERQSPAAFTGSDRDPRAVAAARANAERAGLGDRVRFVEVKLSEVQSPDGQPGLVLTNPPYGQRIGDPKELEALYRAFGQVMRERFRGWRVGVITSEPKLAKATGLDFASRTAPVPHGPLRIACSVTAPLP
jgi:putative N6-adenine-specific DNA methylase